MPELEPEEVESQIAKALTVLEIRLISDVDRAAISLNRLVNTLQAQGVSNDAIRTALLTDLQNDGPVFGELNRSIERSVRGSVATAAEAGSETVFKKEFGDNYRAAWQAVLVNTCPDCLGRHGQVENIETWRLLGVPPTWGSVCDPNCKCQIIPLSISESAPELKDPIKRESRKIRKQGGSVPRDLSEPNNLSQRRSVRKLGELNKE